MVGLSGMGSEELSRRTEVTLLSLPPLPRRHMNGSTHKPFFASRACFSSLRVLTCNDMIPSYLARGRMCMVCGAKCLGGKEVLLIRCKQIEVFDRSFEEPNPGYTHYSCFGLLPAFQWLWLAR